MAIVSPLLLPPSPFSSFVSSMENIPPLGNPQRFPLQIPFQQPVSSASQMPISPRGSSSSNTSIAKYAESYRLLMEHQRHVHEEERSLWQIERQELQARVAELETLVRKHQQSHLSNVSSPSAVSFHTGMEFGGSIKSCRSMSESTGDEYWRGAGGRSNAKPTRTFSDPEIIPPKLPDRWMPSIAEDEPTDKVEVTKDRQQKLRHKPSIDGVKIDKNLDGIIFKPSGLPLEIVKNIMTPQSPSPSDAISPTGALPSQIRLSSTNRLTAEDLYTKDAGHTPLARMTDIDSHSVSNVPTPTQVERERPPLEPCPSVNRPPNERADSYFPAIPEPINEDPELQGPLGLRNDEAADADFLEELDCKLERVASEPRELSEQRAIDSSITKKGKSIENKDSDNSFDQDEPEPKLRIKRSMNFGSRFGSSTCGKV